MANKYYTNRYSFWSDNKSNIVKIDKSFDSYGFFEKNYFSDDLGVVKFFNLIRDRFSFPGDLTEVYQKFACDLVNNKTYCKTSNADNDGSTGGGGTNTSGTTKKSKYTNTSGTTKKSKYTKCSEQLPIKQYCKNETIRKVQACLKMPKRYQTGNFGPITQEYLESRNQNGTLITTETIINICGANHPLVSGVPYSSVPKTGYEDYTVDEIEYSNDVQNTKPSTPSSEKPEGEGTGYEGYSEEKPQPVSLPFKPK